MQFLDDWSDDKPKDECGVFSIFGHPQAADASRPLAPGCNQNTGAVDRATSVTVRIACLIKQAVLLHAYPSHVHATYLGAAREEKTARAPVLQAIQRRTMV